MLEAVNRKMEQFIRELNDKDSLELYLKLPKGKQLRAKLILYISGNSLASIKTASVVELIHLASLLHDDVIDNAKERRGKTSLNAIYGNKTAIMLGDILYSKGFYELTKIDKEVALLISNGVTELSIGELKDVNLSNEFNIDKKAYIEMLYQKTGALMEACAGVGAFLANKPKKAFMIYGKNLGIAFQMIDDILDITQTKEQLGKPAMHDYKEGKTTLPYIYLYEKLNEKDKKYLKSLHKRTLTKEQEEWIKNKMNEFNIIETCKLEAKELIVEALEVIKNENQKLSQIAYEMIERNF